MEIPHEIQPEDFQLLLKDRLGDYWDRAKILFDNFGEYHNRSMTCLFDLAAEEDRTERVVSVLEQAWDEYLSYIPDPVTTHVEIKILFDVIYADVFGDVLARRFGLEKLPIIGTVPDVAKS